MVRVVVTILTEKDADVINGHNNILRTIKITFMPIKTREKKRTRKRKKKKRNNRRTAIAFNEGGTAVEKDK